MQGLLLKDLYLMRKYCRLFALVLLVFWALAVVEPGNLFILIYPGIIISQIPVTLLSLDEKAGWEQYSGTLPVTRDQIVTGKYLMGLGCCVGTFLAILVAQMLGMALGRSAPTTGYPLLWGISFGFGLLTLTVSLPFAFRYGTQKGRNVYLCCMILFMVMSMLIAGEWPAAASVRLPNGAIGFLMALGSLALYCLSWRLSIAFYRKREL